MYHKLYSKWKPRDLELTCFKTHYIYVILSINSIHFNSVKNLDSRPKDLYKIFRVLEKLFQKYSILSLTLFLINKLALKILLTLRIFYSKRTD